MGCPQSQYTPIYDNQFFDDIEKCSRLPQLLYCDCYDKAAIDSQARAQLGNVDAARQAQQQARDAYNRAHGGYAIMSPGSAPPLNLPSRANQKLNTFSKTFDPKQRRIMVLLIAAVLLFVAFVSYD